MEIEKDEKNIIEEENAQSNFSEEERAKIREKVIEGLEPEDLPI